METVSDKTAGFTDSVIRNDKSLKSIWCCLNLSRGFPDFHPHRRRSQTDCIEISHARTASVRPDAGRTEPKALAVMNISRV